MLSAALGVALCHGVASAQVSPAHPAIQGRQGAADRAALPSLSAVLAMARRRAPDVVVARAQAQASRSSYVHARRAPLENPLLEVTGDRATAGGSRSVAINGTLWLPVEFAGQRGSRIAEADAYVALHNAGLEQTRASAVAEGVRVYGYAVVAAARVRVLEEIVANAERETEVYSARRNSGDATLLDAKIAEVDWVRNRALLAESRTDLDVAHARIERLLAARYGDVTADPDPPDHRALLRNQSLADFPLVTRLRAEAKYYSRVKDRAGREGTGPLSLMVLGGRGEFGDMRVGGGLSYALPIFRYNQGEQARAEGERQRALTELGVRQRVLNAELTGLVREIQGVRHATRQLKEAAIPAAADAVAAAVATHRAGKTDLLSVLVTRRDLALLRLRALELAQREWLALADLVEITGTTL